MSDERPDRRSSEVRKAMTAKGKGPLRRGGLRGRHEPKREHNKSGGRVREDEDDDKNWTKKFQEGELDDLLVTGREEDDDEGKDDELDDTGDGDADARNS
jgi:hypothetical protein